ncbi:hypothetical protein DL766_005438 [Monosporascus sp. MC13-8B]|uniref:Uncharacterized protein n=1 Tax=Monosporascus cannonballus TaxID=155416 RepID=A0ABY0GST8_9PEZI|nr:hypothetical protein DL762_009892 [Monosporascus cannonballus]RYO96748.1 hypothetical protein DL763_003024 [Monosporascus cannonballus]RYP29341.1 hypothetical protein DL766_005438 [Monosporascus sp. MC13-8B]
MPDKRPRRKSGLGPVEIGFFLYILMVVLDIGMLIVAVMAYKGAQSSDDRKVIKETFITFPTAGHHIQRTEIALASLGIIAHPFLMTRYAMRDSLSGAGMKVFLLKWPLPWHVVNLAAWAVLAAFQAPYVPLLGRDLLPECVYYGSELSQCGCVTASWIFAMLYGVFHLTFALLVLETLGRLRRDAREEEDRAGNRAAHKAAEEKRKQESRLAKAV